MKQCGLLGGLLMLLIQVAASQNPSNDESNTTNITGNVEMEAPKDLGEDSPRWFFGMENNYENLPNTQQGHFVHQPNRPNTQQGHFVHQVQRPIMPDYDYSLDSLSDSSSYSSDHSKSSKERSSSRTSEESDDDRSATTRRPKTTRRTTYKPSRESKDSHSDSSHKSSESHSYSSHKSSESHSDSSHKSSESHRERSSSSESRETTKKPTKRTTVAPKTTTKKSHESSSSSSSSEESRETTKKPTKGTTVTPKTTTKKSHESSSSSSSEERPETTKKPTKGTTVTPKTTTKKSHESHSSSSSSEESEDSSMETCVGHKPVIMHELSELHGDLPIEGSRKHPMLCDDHHKKRCLCSHNPYRSLNGTCNNLKHPDSGVIDTPLRRVVAARYCDGKSTVRRSSVDGRPLPCTRSITSQVFSTKINRHETITQFTAIFWIFVAEDIYMEKHRESKDSHWCCAPDGNMIPKKDLPDSCLPIKIPKHDPFFSTFPQRCLHYERSVTAKKCEKDHHRPINQLNMKTAYLDLSPIYGTCKEQSNKFRAHVKGLLKTKLVMRGHHDKSHRSFLPNVEDARKVCGFKRKDDVCYLSGNSQLNKIVTLAALQTLFVRYHNSIALRLHKMHPHWNDEELFQQTRKIMIGIYQNLIYNEWLPTLLGKETLKRLKLPFNKLRSDYDHEVDAAAISDMATAGLTMSNTLISSAMSLMDEKRNSKKKIPLISTINDPSILEKTNYFDAIIRGFTAQPAEAFDGNFTKEFLNLEVVSGDGQLSGLDLVATDLQSGRDYGISTYNDARELCGLKRAKKFENFEDTLKKKSIHHLQYAYACTNDVDLLVGLLLEKCYDGGVLGRVGSCLFGEQFSRLRKGDRFFATAEGHEHSFTKGQFDAILAVKFSTLVCRSADHVKYMQLKSFHQISSVNALKPCTEIPKLDLTPWENMKLPEKKCLH